MILSLRTEAIMLFLIKNESKKIKIFVGILLLIFLITCILTSLYYKDKLLLGSFEKFDNDDVKYLRSAQTLINTGEITYKDSTTPTVFIMPGIVIILAPFVKLFGMEGAVMPFRIFSAFLMTVNLYIIFLIALKIFDRRVALITLICNIIYVPHIYASTQVLTETMFVFLFELMNLVIIYAIEEKKVKYYVFGGTLLGLSIMFRPAIALYPILVFVMWLINKYSLRDMIKFAIAAIIPVIVIMFPWWVRNYILFDRFIPFTLSSGNPMMQGAFINNKIDQDLIKHLNTDNLKYTGNEVEDNAVELKIADKVREYNYKNNFKDYIIWNTVGKTVANFKSCFCWFPLYNQTYKTLNILHYVYIIMAVLGTINLIKIKNKYGYFILFSIIYFNLVHLPFLAFPRYMYPVMPFVIMLGASVFMKERKINE
jgi:4-amino-4-deoxy-L-arabinose transferase-like glycosyltransferase